MPPAAALPGGSSRLSHATNAAASQVFTR
jgi:hypothetical protein